MNSIILRIVMGITYINIILNVSAKMFLKEELINKNIRKQREYWEKGHMVLSFQFRLKISLIKKNWL